MSTVRLASTVVGRGARAAHARRRPAQYGHAHCARRTAAVAADAEASTMPARGLPFLASATAASVQHVRPPPRRTATWRAAPLLAPTLTTACAAALRPCRLGGQAARRVRLPLAARTRRPAWSRPAFCRSNAGAPPRVEASAACMPGNAGAGVAEPERRLRAGTSPWRSCRRDRAQGKFGGIAETTRNRLNRGKSARYKVAPLCYYTDRVTPTTDPFASCRSTI